MLLIAVGHLLIIKLGVQDVSGYRYKYEQTILTTLVQDTQRIERREINKCFIVIIILWLCGESCKKKKKSKIELHGWTYKKSRERETLLRLNKKVVQRKRDRGWDVVLV